jgi:SAM-dependent methyltransferase
MGAYEETCCNLCDGSQFTLEMKVKDYVSQEIFHLVQCQDCGLVFVNPRPHVSTIVRYYPEGIYRRSVFSSFGFWLRKKRLDRYLRAAKPGRVLDIGCGDGRELLYLRDKGWQTVGTELSESLYAQVRSAGIEAHCGALETIGFAAESFDVVMMWHVIEHLSSPKQTLREAHKILKPGGILLLGCPNYHSIDVKLARAKTLLEAPRHLCYFTESTLFKLLTDTGFAITAVHWFSLEIGVVSMLQGLLNILPLTGATPNFLLDWMGSGLYRERLGKAYRWHWLVNMILMLPMGCLSLLLVALASLYKFSPTIELSARKK